MVMVHDFNDFGRCLFFPFDFAVVRTARPIELLFRVMAVLHLLSSDLRRLLMQFIFEFGHSLFKIVSGG